MLVIKNTLLFMKSSCLNSLPFFGESFLCSEFIKSHAPLMEKMAFSALGVVSYKKGFFVEAFFGGLLALNSSTVRSIANRIFLLNPLIITLLVSKQRAFIALGSRVIGRSIHSFFQNAPVEIRWLNPKKERVLRIFSRSYHHPLSPGADEEIEKFAQNYEGIKGEKLTFLGITKKVASIFIEIFPLSVLLFSSIKISSLYIAASVATKLAIHLLLVVSTKNKNESRRSFFIHNLFIQKSNFSQLLIDLVFFLALCLLKIETTVGGIFYFAEAGIPVLIDLMYMANQTLLLTH